MQYSDKKKPSADNKLTTKGTCLIHANILYDIANCCYLDCLLQSRKGDLLVRISCLAYFFAP